jgi:hypothetical protein
MSYALPFIDNNGNSQQFGNEFDKMYNLELGQNMMIPQEPTTDYNTGMKYTLYDTADGIYNQAKLFENNNDPQEDQQTTDQQAMERIRNTSGINRQLSESEKRFNLYTTNNFDIRFRNQLKSESEKAGDNIFSEFSQDHVNAVRNANENYVKEENLYETPETKQLNMLDKLSIGDGKSATNQALSALMGMARAEQKLQRRRQRFRERAAGKTQETMTDKITKMTEGKPPVQPTPVQPTRVQPKPAPKPAPKPRSRYEEVTWFL